jgi:Fe-S oxidoreductase
MERVLGIHRHRNLPRVHRQTFSRWFAAHPAPVAGPVARVALFATCQVEYHDPAVGRATVAVLRRNRVDVALPEPRCCGMPYLDGGAVVEARRLVDENVRRLAPLAREGVPIVTPGPTCSYTMKQEWPWLASDGEAARVVAGQTRDLFEYLARLHAEGRLDTDFAAKPGRVAYQLPCHLRAQNIGAKSADVLRLTGADVEVIERCSAVDGTWGFKREYYELSMTLAGPLFREIGAVRPDRVVTDCPLAALQITQGTGRPVRHPVQVLAEAYGLPAD